MKINRVIILYAVVFLASCNSSYTSKPLGHLKVEYPEKEYVMYKGDAPFQFEYPAYAELEKGEGRDDEIHWYNMNFPMYKSTLHLSYKPLQGDVDLLIRESRDLVYKHASQSDGIDEIPFIDKESSNYGILYELGGNVASAVQFFITDSTEHFLRGSLYFNTTPNRDSLNPIINFIEEDITHMMETVEWK